MATVGNALGKYCVEGKISPDGNAPAGGGGFSLQGEISIQIENLGHGANQNNSSSSDETRDKETIDRHLKLHTTALTGNWKEAKEIRERVVQLLKLDEFNERITRRNETALHIATMFEQTNFAKKLVAEMSLEGLKVANKDSHTALCLSAINGNKKIAEAILQRHPELAWDRGDDDDGLLPLHRASFSGRNKEMVRYLYQRTKNHLKDEDFPDLLVALIKAGIFDVVLDMTTKRGLTERRLTDLATTGAKHLGETAFHAMAQKPDMFSKAGYWRELFRSCAQDDKKRRARELLKKILQTMLLQSENTITQVVQENWRTIFVAVERGNLEFLRMLIRTYPEMVTETDSTKGWTIFHAAIVHRQEKIFALIHEIGLFRKIVAERIDNEGNNMLHLAAQLVAESRLDIIPGAALKLQHELLWFQEVKDVVGPQLAEAKNINLKNAKTPRKLFLQNHDDLIKSGEKWMTETANSCSIVAVLVATVAFAAAFTLPGGNDQNTGFPVFLHGASLKIFIVADAVSFICSASSVLTFLSILTSTYALDDFVQSLPLKLLIGLFTLFASIVAMMVAFVTVFFLYFKQRRRVQLDYAVPVTVFAFVPVGLFVWFHRHIFIDMIKSTYKWRCNSLFRPDRYDPLFPSMETNLCNCSMHFSCFSCCVCKLESWNIIFKKRA